MKNKVITAREAIMKIKDGDRVMVGGFGLRGTPFDLVEELAKSGRKDLTIISNDLGGPNEGLGMLLTNGQIKALIGNFYNWNADAVRAYNEGLIQVTLVPQGTFTESIRAAGMGIPAYYTLASAGTELGKGKETREFGGRTYVLEHAIHADVALVEADRADTLGNLTYCKTARNFNPLMATAGKYTVALVREIVKPGEIDPEHVITPHIFVNAIVKQEAR